MFHIRKPTTLKHRHGKITWLIPERQQEKKKKEEIKSTLWVCCWLHMLFHLNHKTHMNIKAVVYGIGEENTHLNLFCSRWAAAVELFLDLKWGNYNPFHLRQHAITSPKLTVSLFTFLWWCSLYQIPQHGGQGQQTRSQMLNNWQMSKQFFVVKKTIHPSILCCLCGLGLLILSVTAQS